MKLKTNTGAIVQDGGELKLDNLEVDELETKKITPFIVPTPPEEGVLQFEEEFNIGNFFQYYEYHDWEDGEDYDDNTSLTFGNNNLRYISFEAQSFELISEEITFMGDVSFFQSRFKLPQGTTEQRPTVGSYVKGVIFYDITLLKCIVWNGTA